MMGGRLVTNCDGNQAAKEMHIQCFLYDAARGAHGGVGEFITNAGETTRSESGLVMRTGGITVFLSGHKFCEKMWAER
jgi:hypothetical protein